MQLHPAAHLVSGPMHHQQRHVNLLHQQVVWEDICPGRPPSEVGVEHPHARQHWGVQHHTCDAWPLRRQPHLRMRQRQQRCIHLSGIAANASASHQQVDAHPAAELCRAQLPAVRVLLACFVCPDVTPIKQLAYFFSPRALKPHKGKQKLSSYIHHAKTPAYATHRWTRADRLPVQHHCMPLDAVVGLQGLQHGPDVTAGGCDAGLPLAHAVACVVIAHHVDAQQPPQLPAGSTARPV